MLHQPPEVLVNPVLWVVGVDADHVLVFFTVVRYREETDGANLQDAQGLDGLFYQDQDVLRGELAPGLSNYKVPAPPYSR